MGVDDQELELKRLRGAVLALCDVVLTLANESYARGVLSLEDDDRAVRRERNETLLNGIASVIVERMYVEGVLSRKFDPERLVEHVKGRIFSMAEEWIAGFADKSLGDDLVFHQNWGLRVRHRRTSEVGRALAFEGERVVVEWDGSPPRRASCSVDDVECD